MNTETWQCSDCENPGAWKRWNGDRLEIHCTDHMAPDSEPLEPEWPEIIGDQWIKILYLSWFDILRVIVTLGVFIAFLILLIANAK